MSEKKCKYCETMIPEDAKLCPECKKKVKDTFFEKFVFGFMLATFGGVAFVLKRIIKKMEEMRKS